MPRRYRPPRRAIIPDVRYNSEMLSQFIAKMMRDGKKSTAQRIAYDAMELVQQRAHRNPLEVFEQAVNNVNADDRDKAATSRRCHVPGAGGGRARTDALSLALRWLVNCCTRARPGKSMVEKLAS
jgi:small subunit ribosomal protein S7